MPVPRERNDEAYFEPLAGLDFPQGTDLYLGLVHEGDDANNAHKLVLARKFARVAGVAAECGLGRGDPARIDAVLAAHDGVAAIE
jgi:hypothetical protein